MREIKFRGWFQCITGREYWVYGYPSKQENGNWEITNDAGMSFTVENVEQYTGLKDKNDVEIYESDLILYQDCKGEVYYCNDTCMFMVKFKTAHSSWSFDSMDDEIEVVGNIDENPYY